MTKTELLIKAKKPLEVRIKTLREIEWWVDYLLKEELDRYDPKILLYKNTTKHQTIEILKDAASQIALAGVFSFEQYARTVMTTKYGLKLGQIVWPIRVALSGKTVSLPVFETLSLLGAEISYRRLIEAANKLENVNA